MVGEYEYYQGIPAYAGVEPDDPNAGPFDTTRRIYAECLSNINAEEKTFSISYSVRSKPNPDPSLRHPGTTPNRMGFLKHFKIKYRYISPYNIEAVEDEYHIRYTDNGEKVTYYGYENTELFRITWLMEWVRIYDETKIYDEIRDPQMNYAFETLGLTRDELTALLEDTEREFQYSYEGDDAQPC